MFELDLRSREPIYEQLVEKVKELIINQVLKADEQLPAVRIMASELTVNPNTIQKAYRELEKRGYIYSIPGKGSFVRAAVETDHTTRLKTLQTELLKTASEMLYLGMALQDLVSLVEAQLSSKGGQTND
ncbi:MAG: GntR family transcriptional regulator [Syntrophomonadaceae bacterium]